MKGRKQAGQDQVKRKERKGGWNPVRRNEGQRMKEENRSEEGNQEEWTQKLNENRMECREERWMVKMK